jgi:adenylate cyclase
MPALLLLVALCLAALILRALLRRRSSRVDPRLVDCVIAHPDPALLTPALRDITVLRTNLDDMTATFDRLGDTAATALLNEYFAALVPVIRRHRGLIIQFEFDKVFALFGAPTTDTDHPANALRATLDLQQALADLNTSLAARNLPTLRMRIGVATGLARVGDLGTPAAAFYTAVGEPVTLARTLERTARLADLPNLVSPETHARTHHLFQFGKTPDGNFEVRGAQ